MTAARAADGNRHVARVDDLVRQVAYGPQLCYFVPDSLADGPVSRQGMRPARFTETADERLGVGLEKNQHRIEPARLAQPVENLGKLRGEVALPDVDDDRDLLDAVGAERQPRKRLDQRGRQVVDA